MPRYIDLSHKPKEIQMAAHTIGLDHKRPYQRHGKFFYRPYWNYFSTHGKDIYLSLWQGLCDKGYAKCGNGYNPGTIVFWLTRAGLDWLGQELGITIYDEED